MNSTQHPLVATYLDDLARMLADLPPEDRAEVLAGVREHVDAALVGQAGTEADVQRVLTELGPPDVVAREAFESGSSAVRSPLPAAPAKPPISDRRWVPVVVAVLQALALLILLVNFGSNASVTVMEASDGTSTIREVHYAVGSSMIAAVVSAIVALPLWIVVVLLVGNSSLWTARQKLAHVLLLPVAALVLGGLPELGWVLFGERGLNVTALIALAVALLGGGWLVVRLTAAGRRRAAAALSR